MPLKLNVGASQKVADSHYGSRGAAVSLEIELDSGLVAEPAKLQDRIRQLFTLVRSSLAQELNGNGHATTPQNGNGPSKTQKPTNGSGTSRNGGQRQATQSQVKAIHAIARSRRIDVEKFLNERFRVGNPDDLTIKQASSAIDELKKDGE